jgi:hypothetical protein
VFIFQFTQFKATEIKEDAIKKTPILAGGAMQMEWKQLELSIRNESKNKGYDQKTTDTIVGFAKKLWQSNDYDGLQKLLKTWELTETLTYVQKEIETQKTKSQPKGGGAQKTQQEETEGGKRKKTQSKVREDALSKAPKTKTPGEEKAEKSPDMKKDAPATDFFTKSKQD